MKYTVEKELIDKGIKIAMAVYEVESISKRRGSGLKQYIKEVITTIGERNHNVIFEASEQWYAEVGVEGISPSRHLLYIVNATGSLPNINRVVDVYNAISLETGLSAGAHDCDSISGDIVYRETGPQDSYLPLFGTEKVVIGEGEYGCCDEEKVLCRMDIKQCDQTKVTTDTKRFIVYVQGNLTVTQTKVDDALKKVCELMKECCNASYEVIA